MPHGADVLVRALVALGDDLVTGQGPPRKSHLPRLALQRIAGWCPGKTLVVLIALTVLSGSQFPTWLNGSMAKI